MEGNYPPKMFMDLVGHLRKEDPKGTEQASSGAGYIDLPHTGRGGRRRKHSTLLNHRHPCLTPMTKDIPGVYMLEITPLI